MDIKFGNLLRSLLLDLLERLRELLKPGGGEASSPIFRELVRNGTFEKPVLGDNYWSRAFDPATSGGWTEEHTDRYSHMRIDGWGAFRSNHFASLRQNAIVQVLNTTGLAGQSLDVSLYFYGKVSVTIGSTRHVPVWNPDTYDGSGYSRSSFTYTVKPEEVPLLTLRILGESPEEFVESDGMKYPVVRDGVDQVSVLAWNGPPPSAAMIQFPGQDQPVLIRQLP